MPALPKALVSNENPSKRYGRMGPKMSGTSRNFDTIVKASSKYKTETVFQHDMGASLTSYMRLPVDQYVCIDMPLNSTLRRTENEEFELVVPPVTIFKLSVSPTVYCQVKQTPDQVLITSNRVYLGGSDYVRTLNGCYNIQIKSVFGFRDTEDERVITSESVIDVQVDPPKPFSYLPRRVLQSTGNLAMNIALRQIENAFINSLAKDYSRWATDEAYRDARAQGACLTDFSSSGTLTQEDLIL